VPEWMQEASTRAKVILEVPLWLSVVTSISKSVLSAGGLVARWPTNQVSMLESVPPWIGSNL